MLPRLLDHLIWADRRTADAIATLDVVPDEVLTIWAHLLAAEATWIARIEGLVPPVAVWPTLTLAECADRAERNHQVLARYSKEHGPDDPGRQVRYTNSRGQAFTNTVEEILHQVVMHGMYHRGQLAQAVRFGGGTPVATDLIAYLRER